VDLHLRKAELVLFRFVSLRFFPFSLAKWTQKTYVRASGCLRNCSRDAAPSSERKIAIFTDGKETATTLTFCQRITLRQPSLLRRPAREALSREKGRVVDREKRVIYVRQS
jgi:hypothetical protein